MVRERDREREQPLDLPKYISLEAYTKRHYDLLSTHLLLIFGIALRDFVNFIYLFSILVQIDIQHFYGHSRPLFRLFSSFQTNITILTTNISEKCHDHPVYGTCIQTHDP